MNIKPAEESVWVGGVERGQTVRSSISSSSDRQVLLHLIVLPQDVFVVAALQREAHLLLQRVQAGLADVVPDALRRQQLLQLFQLLVRLRKKIKRFYIGLTEEINCQKEFRRSISLNKI